MRKGEVSEVMTDGNIDKLVSVRRTAKVVKGGRIFGFSALVVVGDQKGRIGYGLGKAKEVPVAIKKATDTARCNMVHIPLCGTTLYHRLDYRQVSTRVVILPASDGTGIIAGNAMRAVFEVLGIENVLAKCIGSSNPVNVVRATVEALTQMETPERMAAKRGKTIAEIVGE